MSKMLFLSERDAPERMRVETIHHRPDLVPEDSKDKGILVEDIPKPDGRRKGVPMLFYNAEKGELFYEYEKPPPPEEPEPEDPEADERPSDADEVLPEVPGEIDEGGE